MKSDGRFELVRVSGSEAVQKWHALREEGRGVFTPVILVEPENYALDGDALAELQLELPKTLAAAEAMSVADFFARRKSENAALLQELEAGDWPALPYRLEPYLPRHSGEVVIAKVPTPNSYEALAYVGFGGWNDCPYDAEHVAVFRHWHDRYGADLFAISGDILECVVERPPATREAALDLAREHTMYAPGTLGEFSGGGSSVPELAGALFDSRHWLFWWD